MRKYWWIILIGLIVALVLIPLGIAFMLSFRLIETDTTNEWIGFWGGYLGSILGGIITLIVMKYTLQEEKKAREREEKIEYFNHVVKVVTETQYAIMKYAICVKEHISKKRSSIDDRIQESDLGNWAAKFSLELQILLKTRKDQYSLNDFLEMHLDIMANMEKMKTLYNKCTIAKMEDDLLNIQLGQLIDELCIKVNSVEKILVTTVKSNLY